MKIESIKFENYKAFKNAQTLKIKPITVLIGKNSSGKSAIAKLFTLFKNSLGGLIDEPLLLKNNGVELGAQFIDIVYGKLPINPISFEIKFDSSVTLSVKILQEIGAYNLQIIEWKYITENSSLEISYSRDTGYIDKDGNQYTCKFNGFIPVEIINLNGENIAKNFPIKLESDIDYIGPFRILPERQFYLSGQIVIQDIGIKGENAYAMLGVSSLIKSDLQDRVALWFEEHFDGWRLLVDSKNRPYFQLLLSKEGIDINIVDVGQGMNQALPLIVRANVAKPNSIIVIEQPELHLHPAAHGDLAELFASTSKQFQQSYLIETHSENMVLRLRKLVVENNFDFSNDDMVIYWISDDEGGGQGITEITINDEGVPSEWPSGVFNENITEIIEMRKAVNRKSE